MVVVIIGGDAAGMSAASQAKRANDGAEVIVLEKTGDVSYGACGLPYKLPAGKKMEDLQIISAQRFREERGIDLRTGHEVERIDPAAKTVTGCVGDEGFQIAYDKLIIATGARVWTPPIPGLEALWGRGAYALKTLDDGRVIKAALERRPPKRVVVIGAGYIGLEATENLREMGAEVMVVEALPQIVPFLPAELSARVEQEAEKHGVTMLKGTRVEGLAAKGETIEVATAAGTLVADLVLVATGVRPEATLAKAAGLELGAAGSIAVDELLQTSAPDIYAAGDCADATHGVTGRSVWFPLALRANRAGKLAGDNIFGAARKAPPVLGTAVFKFFGLEIARTGLSQREADEGGYESASATILGSTRAHYYGGGGKISVWLLGEKGSGKLLGCAMVGPEAAAHKIDTAVAAISAGMTAEQLYDLDLAYAPPFGPSWSPLLIAASKLAQAL